MKDRILAFLREDPLNQTWYSEYEIRSKIDNEGNEIKLYLSHLIEIKYINEKVHAGCDAIYSITGAGLIYLDSLDKSHILINESNSNSGMDLRSAVLKYLYDHRHTTPYGIPRETIVGKFAEACGYKKLHDSLTTLEEYSLIEKNKDNPDPYVLYFSITEFGIKAYLENNNHVLEGYFQIMLKSNISTSEKESYSLQISNEEKGKIIELIKNDGLGQAFAYTDELTKRSGHTETRFIQLYAQFNQVENQRLEGIIFNEEYTIRINQIRGFFLKLLGSNY